MFRDLLKKDIKTITNAFKWTSFIFTSIVLIVFLILYFADKKPERELFITVLLIASTGFPIFISGITLLRWYFDYRITLRTFKSDPFNQLEKIGFEKCLKNENSYLKNICECYYCSINGFWVECSVDTDYKYDLLEFRYFVKQRIIDKKEFIRLKKELKGNNLIIDYDSVVKRYHYKKHNLSSVYYLEKELQSFADEIRNLKFEPEENARR